ncbi:MAG TPA: ABC transporter ATP-binding protein [Smithellaceae bacterium]|jgi:branched-chain amino acid transport system ATP-binding protein|nr:ABC transporter ATP-binding protein [Syntrophaceae bacterium]NMD05980.1 ABC transporter ATP-binding protein [Deltaproteobacteria bacterium]HNQ18531.1 ABC transporter ATP-binding protein [Smithellaceae bacterium]HNT91276.1 ABC transporter ATP-binding protein [Smithellaceae bacterium]HNV64744.1 ABC transporter ATP-binding protein [Smithellaceae bacterium]
MAELLIVDNITKTFGGIVAVHNLSFSIQEGETLGFIGPNGAGKSTVVNVLSGYLEADSGKVEMNGVNITKMKPYQRVHIGLARTYQIPRPFPELTALTSVAASALCGKKRINQSFEDALVEATHYLEFVGLFSKRNILARDLTFYELRMLELARALATTPKLLFIDEVMAGLNPPEANNAVKLIARAKEEFGVTVFWIEHVMAVLMEAADRIIAINYGEKIADGTPDEVVNNEAVIEAYLGRGWKTYA